MEEGSDEWRPQARSLSSVDFILLLAVAAEDIQIVVLVQGVWCVIAGPPIGADRGAPDRQLNPDRNAPVFAV